jgi:hypothetical protein
MINIYDDVTGVLVDIAKEKYNIGEHDISIQPGSTLPTSKWALYNVYLEAYQLGLIDKTEVLKKNPEIFDKEGILKRMSEISQLKGTVEQLQGTVKDLQGDLQTARRESVSDRKRVEVEKFKSKLSSVESDTKANSKIQANKLDNAVKLAVEQSRDLFQGIGDTGSAEEAA